MSVPNHLLAESHRRQFSGEGYQSVAVDLIEWVKNATEDDFHSLCTSPEPECDCGFCANAEWQD